MGRRLWPDEKMEAIIGKVRYRVSDSVLLAHNSYWDNNDFTRHGRNTFLYRSPKGKYFAVHMTMWAGEKDRIEPLSEDTAYQWFEDLPEKEVKVEEAFPSIVVDSA